MVTVARQVLRELKGADVVRVSIVDHGANRIPFRIVKRLSTGVKNMGFDLNNVRHLWKNDGVKNPPTLMALLFENEPKGTELDRIKSVVEKAGLKTDAPVVNEDQTFMFVQQELPKDEKDLTIVQLSPDVAAVFKGFAPWTDSLENFTEVMQANNFYPGLGSACNALNQTICQKMQNASDPAEAVVAVTAVLKDFGAYVAGLAQALPVSAFKLANDFAPVIKTIKAERVTAAAVEAVKKAAAKAADPATTPVIPVTDPPVVVKADMVKPDNVAQADWDKMDDAGKAAACAAAKKAETPPVVNTSVDIAAITKSVADALAPTFAGLTDAVAALKTDVTGIKTEVALVSTSNGDLKKKFETTVLGSAEPVENPLKTAAHAMKGAGPFGGSCDTALAPKNFRNQN